MNKTLLASVCAGLLALGGCATSPAPSGAAPAAGDFDALVAKAEQEIKAAAKTGFLWTNTEKFLEDAKAAQKAGDMNKATSLAKKALDEAQLAQQQAKANANPKPVFTQ